MKTKITLYPFDGAYAPLSVGKDDTIYGAQGSSLWSSKDMVSVTKHALFHAISPGITRIEGVAITRSGKVVVSTGREANKGGEIWVADSLEGTFEKKLDNAGEGYGDAHFRNANFVHYSALDKDILLAGTYGIYNVDTNPNPCNRLYMSLDEGMTWNLIFQPATRRATRNNHIHAVAYDPYYNWIWAAYGDMENAGISYSPDLGATWVEVSTTLQPTAIVVLPKMVVFATDDPTLNAGVYAWIRPKGGVPKSFVGTDIEITHLWNLPHTNGAYHIARRGSSIDDKRAIIPFVKSESVLGSFLLGTTNGGLSWQIISADINTPASWQLGLTNPNSKGEVYGYYANRMTGKVLLK